MQGVHLGPFIDFRESVGVGFRLAAAANAPHQQTVWARLVPAECFRRRSPSRSSRKQFRNFDGAVERGIGRKSRLFHPKIFLPLRIPETRRLARLVSGRFADVVHRCTGPPGPSGSGLESRCFKQRDHRCGSAWRRTSGPGLPFASRILTPVCIKRR